MPHWQMHSVSIKALVGSPRLDDTENGAKNGIIPSLAIAWNFKTRSAIRQKQCHLHYDMLDKIWKKYL